MRSKQDRPAASQRAPRTASGPRDAVVNALPTNLLFTLAIAGMKSTDKGPDVTLGELGMLRDRLTGGLEGAGGGGQGPVTGREGSLCSDIQGQATGAAPDGPGGA